MEIGETLLASSRQEWREWLAEHHRDYKEIWLIYYKKTSGKTGISYEESVEEALCFGWIDGQTRGIDQDAYAGRFTPRRPKSPWSDSNRERVARLLREGRMAEAGLAVLDSISDGFIVLDTHWCYSYVNRAAETILQKQREDLLGKNVREVFPEAIGTTFWTKYYEAADTQTIVEFEAFYPPFGKWFHVRVYPSQAGLAIYFQDMTERSALGKFTDLTERKQAEEDQLRLAAIVASSDDAIIGKTLDGIITNWNLAAENMFGYTTQEAIGKHITLIIPAELREEEDAILQKLRNGQHIDHYETVRVRKDGTRIDISLSISPIKNKEGQIIGASKIARDISERKRLQKHLQFLSHASKVLSSSLDYKMTLQTIANLAVPPIAEWCAIDMLAEDGSSEPFQGWGSACISLVRSWSGIMAA